MRHLLGSARGDRPSWARKGPAGGRSTTATTAASLITVLVLVVCVFADAALATPRPLHRRRCQRQVARGLAPAMEAGSGVAGADEGLVLRGRETKQPSSTLVTMVQSSQSSTPTVLALPADQAVAATMTTTTTTTRTIQISLSSLLTQVTSTTASAIGGPQVSLSSLPSPTAIPSEQQPSQNVPTVMDVQQQQQSAALTAPGQDGIVAIFSNNNNSGSTSKGGNEDDHDHEPPAQLQTPPPSTTITPAAMVTSAATAESSEATITKTLAFRVTTIAKTVTHMVTATVTTSATPSTLISVSVSANSSSSSSSSSMRMASLLGADNLSVVTSITAALAASGNGTAIADPTVTPGPAENRGRLDDNGYQRGYSPATG